MVDKKVKIMSLSLDPEMHELIKSSAKKLGHKNVSQLIRDLVSRHIDLLVNDKEEIPVIIKVPESLKDEPDRLRSWLRFKADAIAEAILKVKQ
jgi:predicted DNA-binding protein